MVSFTTILSCAAAAVLFASGADGANVQVVSRADFRAQFQNQEFAFDLAASQPIDLGFGSTIKPLGVKQQPSLDQEGLTYALVNMQPCAIVVPHVHPRGSELDFVLTGGPLRNIFAEEFPSTKVIAYDISAGQTGLIPQGLLHVQINMGCQPLAFLAALNNEDVGIVAVGATQQFPLTIDGQVSTNPGVRRLEQALGNETPAQLRQQCLQRCGNVGAGQQQQQQGQQQQGQQQQQQGQQQQGQQQQGQQQQGQQQGGEQQQQGQQQQGQQQGGEQQQRAAEQGQQGQQQQGQAQQGQGELGVLNPQLRRV